MEVTSIRQRQGLSGALHIGMQVQIIVRVERREQLASIE